MVKQKGIKLLTVVIAYCCIFFAVWAFCETWLKSTVPIIRLEWFKEIILKVIIWTVPALFLIRHFSKSLAVSLKDMFTNRVNWTHYILLFIGFTLYIIAGAILHHNSPATSHPLLITVAIALSIGIGEELVFRGWLLNAMLTICGKSKQWVAIVLNALLFLCIHIPLWASTGILQASFTSLDFVSILILSVIFSWVFIKSGSIWPGIALHAYWDVLVILLL